MTGGHRGTGAAIEAADGRALVIRADRNDPDAAVAAVAATVRTLGGLDILVNNAGIFIGGPSDRITVKELDDILAADVRAVFLRTTPPPPSRAAGGGGSRVGVGCRRVLRPRAGGRWEIGVEAPASLVVRVSWSRGTWRRRVPSRR
ncbi:SDR family NAD(P)-dependent oxidoreductase [Streptomyces pseudovenezuelae]|uniref:SDR family NAD(P)-dependent oxidoreductase n=1 Tax=Streptomyces pseudovenezuelae TaxID=67350 RepID=UPI00380386FD